jgi:hypothetical protein
LEASRIDTHCQDAWVARVYSYFLRGIAMLIDPSNERILSFILAGIVVVMLIAVVKHVFTNWPDDDEHNGWGGW